MFKNTSGWLLLSTKGAINCLCQRGSSKYGSIVKKRSFLTKFSTMIVKIFAFSVSINFLQSALRSINYFFHTQVNSDCSNMKVQNTFLTKFKIMKLKIDACNVFMIFLTTVPKNL